jgi:hypothetical protein
VARLDDPQQHESALEAGPATSTNHEEWRLPTFARASQNMATVAALLHTLPAPSTDGVGEVYLRLKNILSTAVVHQVESSLHHRVEAYTLPPDRSKARGQ